jgi:phosphoglycerate-specific signal transduction histidine kinase
MRTHIGALGALIDDLFELSRLEAGDITSSLQQVELHELVEETIEAMRLQADAKGVQVTATLPGERTVARANPEKLQRVLFNLIQNAIRHTPADGSVVVRAEPSPEGVEIEVADTGTGIGIGIGIDDRASVFTAMGGVFAGAAQAPLTAIASVVEMTGNFTLTLPVMLAAGIAVSAVEAALPRQRLHDQAAPSRNRH